MKVAYLGTKIPINLETDFYLLQLCQEECSITIIAPIKEITTNYIKSFGDFDCIVTDDIISALRLCAHYKIGTYEDNQLHIFNLKLQVAN